MIQVLFLKKFHEIFKRTGRPLFEFGTRPHEILTPMDTVEMMTDIFQRQIIIVSIVAFLLAIFVAYIISKKFAKPIAQLSEESKKLATGDFNVNFETGFCRELDELADTLSVTADELLKTENLRRDLLANVSHDLRTPLTMIKGYAEMIRDITGENKEKREANLEIIIRESNRLSNMVDDILQLSQLQSGNEILNMENVNFSEIVYSISESFEQLSLGKINSKESFEQLNSKTNSQNSFKKNITPDQFVTADKNKIERVVYNLINNAVSYGDKIVISVIDRGNFVRFEVEDNGKGIKEEDIDFVWDRYYTKRSSGIGIGLSIAKEILEKHNARYGIKSEVGVGTTFWFEISK
jgi:signal transduction histidine kinase